MERSEDEWRIYFVNKKGVDIERVRNQYITSVYSHSLMIYTTMYGYYASLLMSDEEFVN